MNDLPKLAENSFVAIVLAAIFIGADRLLQLRSKWKQARLDEQAKELDLTNKEGTNSRTEYDFVTSKYKEYILKLETQIEQVVKRQDLAEQEHEAKFLALSKEHQQCLVESARQEERLKAHQDRIASNELRIQQLEKQVKGA